MSTGNIRGVVKQPFTHTKGIAEQDVLRNIGGKCRTLQCFIGRIVVMECRNIGLLPCKWIFDDGIDIHTRPAINDGV